MVSYDDQISALELSYILTGVSLNASYMLDTAIGSGDTKPRTNFSNPVRERDHLSNNYKTV